MVDHVAEKKRSPNVSTSGNESCIAAATLGIKVTPSAQTAVVTSTDNPSINMCKLVSTYAYLSFKNIFKNNNLNFILNTNSFVNISKYTVSK